MSFAALMVSCLLALVSSSSPADVAASSLDANRQRLYVGYFPVLMARSGGNLTLIRQAGLDSRLCVQPPTPASLALYAKESLPIYIYIFDGDGVLFLKDTWDKARDGFKKERSVKSLVREPSLFDPAVVAGLKQRVGEFARGYRNADVLAMCVAHEASVTSFASPLDFDHSPLALAEFRQWLERRHGRIENLNAAWDMKFGSFDEVDPPLTDTIMDREYPRYPAMRLAPWFEFREFMDDSFVDLLHQLVAVSRSEAPAIPTSVTVSAIPNAYGGWDYARLLQPGKIDVLETYPCPGSKGIVRGLTAGQTVNVSSLYITKGDATIHGIWRNFLNGERSCVVDARMRELFPEQDRLGGYSARLEPEFSLMRKMASVIRDTQPDDAGVRMIYSQPSIRCHWFIDCKSDGKTYINRGSKYEIDYSTTIQALAGWQDLLGELGIHPLFESYLDLRAGRFRHGTPKVLIASRTCCLGDAELATLDRYVREGGTLLIDESFAMFDEHGNARPTERIPLLDAVRPALRASAGKVDVPNSPEPLARSVGKGRIVLLNATAVRYGQAPRDAARTGFRRAVARFLPPPPATLLVDGQPAFDVDLYRYQTSAGIVYGLCGSLPDAAANGVLECPAEQALLDMASNRQLGQGKVKVEIPANRAVFVQVVGAAQTRPRAATSTQPAER